MDYNNKLFKYRTAGVREYWIVDPQKEWIMVYSFFNDDMNEYSFTDDIPSGIYPGFSLNLSTLNICGPTTYSRANSETLIFSFSQNYKQLRLYSDYKNKSK